MSCPLNIQEILLLMYSDMHIARATHFMGPEVWRTLIVADPIRIHEVNQATLPGALKSCGNLRAGVRAAAIAVLIELIVAFVRPK